MEAKTEAGREAAGRKAIKSSGISRVRMGGVKDTGVGGTVFEAPGRWRLPNTEDNERQSSLSDSHEGDMMSWRKGVL